MDTKTKLPAANFEVVVRHAPEGADAGHGMKRDDFRGSTRNFPVTNQLLRGTRVTQRFRFFRQPETPSFSGS